MNHGGDSDSTGSITGNLLGARDGSGVIPERWLEPLELRDVITEVASDLYDFVDWELDAPVAATRDSSRRSEAGDGRRRSAAAGTLTPAWARNRSTRRSHLASASADEFSMSATMPFVSPRRGRCPPRARETLTPGAEDVGGDLRVELDPEVRAQDIRLDPGVVARDHFCDA